MNRMSCLVAMAALAGLPGATCASADERYAWGPATARAADTLAGRFPPPAGFARLVGPAGSLATWLRGLPLRPAGTRVFLHSGREKGRQNVHLAVVDIDTGKRDLQQCADAVMRLLAEWRYARGEAQLIAFNDTGGGKPMTFARWARGERPKAVGRALAWSPAARPDASYASFRRYIDTVFIWAGTHSLERELTPVSESEIRPGDIFIRGGFPGHAVLVADVVESPSSGERRVLLIQSFMPAQDMHVLGAPDGSAWFALPGGGPMVTPEWVFPPASLRRWPAAGGG